MSYNVHYQNIITFFKKNQKSCQNNLLTSISAPHCERNVGIKDDVQIMINKSTKPSL